MTATLLVFNTETEMSSFWRNFNHWLHWKLSFWQLPVQPVMKISSKWRHFRFSVKHKQSGCHFSDDIFIDSFLNKKFLILIQISLTCVAKTRIGNKSTLVQVIVWKITLCYLNQQLCSHIVSLHWRHSGCDGVSNHKPYDCLRNRLFRRKSKKTSKLCVTGPVDSPHKWPVTRKMFPFDDLIMLSRPQCIKGSVVDVLLQQLLTEQKTIYMAWLVS